MIYPTRVHLAVMKARGDDEATIRRAQESAAASPAVQDLCWQIESAFADVKLGNGVGLRQAQGLDDYLDDATCAKYREKDEKEDWRRIPSNELNACSSSLSFFDAEGMRFHVPAFLIGELLGTYRCGVVFHLYLSTTEWVADVSPWVQMPEALPSQLAEHSKSSFSLLSNEQRRAVRAFLLHAADDPGYEFERPHLLRALDEYWAEP